MTGEAVFVRGAGRTDAGVHADGQVASFDLALAIPPHGLLRGLNSILPRDLAIVDVAEAGARLRRALLGARQGLPLHASGTTSCARRGTRAHRLARARSRSTWTAIRERGRGAGRRARLPRLPRLRLRAAHDARAIVRRLDVDRQGALITVDIEATAFLKNMVRILVGTLVDVGRGRIRPDATARMLATGDRTAGGMTAPAAGPDPPARDLLSH